MQRFYGWSRIVSFEWSYALFQIINVAIQFVHPFVNFESFSSNNSLTLARRFSWDFSKNLRVTVWEAKETLLWISLVVDRVAGSRCINQSKTRKTNSNFRYQVWDLYTHFYNINYLTVTTINNHCWKKSKINYYNNSNNKGGLPYFSLARDWWLTRNAYRMLHIGWQVTCDA